MRYRLRTLLIMLALGPPVLAWVGPQVVQFWHQDDDPLGPTADLDLAFDQAAFSSDKPQVSGFDARPTQPSTARSAP